MASLGSFSTSRATARVESRTDNHRTLGVCLVDGSVRAAKGFLGDTAPFGPSRPKNAGSYAKPTQLIPASSAASVKFCGAVIG